MTRKVTFLVGPAGSGKTTHRAKMSAETLNLRVANGYTPSMVTRSLHDAMLGTNADIVVDPDGMPFDVEVIRFEPKPQPQEIPNPTMVHANKGDIITLERINEPGAIVSGEVASVAVAWNSYERVYIAGIGGHFASDTWKVTKLVRPAVDPKVEEQAKAVTERTKARNEIKNLLQGIRAEIVREMNAATADAKPIIGARLSGINKAIAAVNTIEDASYGDLSIDDI